MDRKNRVVRKIQFLNSFYTINEIFQQQFRWQLIPLFMTRAIAMQMVQFFRLSGSLPLEPGIGKKPLDDPARLRQELWRCLCRIQGDDGLKNRLTGQLEDPEFSQAVTTLVELKKMLIEWKLYV